MKQGIWIAALLVTSASYASGFLPSKSQPATQEVTRVMISFKAPVVTANDEEFLKRLADIAQIEKIELVRSMSGDAYVMRLYCPASCEEPIKRLAGSEIVKAIFRDERAAIQNQSK